MTTSVDAVTAKTPGLTSRQARELPENELEQVSGGLSPTGNQDGTGRSNVTPASRLWSQGEFYR